MKSIRIEQQMFKEIQFRKLRILLTHLDVNDNEEIELQEISTKTINKTTNDNLGFIEYEKPWIPTGNKIIIKATKVLKPVYDDETIFFVEKNLEYSNYDGWDSSKLDYTYETEIVGNIYFKKVKWPQSDYVRFFGNSNDPKDVLDTYHWFEQKHLNFITSGMESKRQKTLLVEFEIIKIQEVEDE